MSASIRLLCLCGTAAIAMPALADEPVTTTPEVVVSATRIETAPEKVGSTVTTVTDKDIAARGVTSVYDALQGVPGLSFTRTGGLGATSQIRVRGADPGQTQVRIDGIEINDPSSTDNSFDFDGLSTAGLKRIEVLRGPQSALYGSDTMGGVIDLQTKTGKGPFTASGMMEGGSYRTLRGEANASGGTEKMGLSLSSSFMTTGGFSRVVNTSEKDGAHERTAHARFTADPTDNWSVDVVGGILDQRADYDDYGAEAANKSKKILRYGKIDNTVRALDDRLENVLSLSVSDTERTNDEPAGWTQHATYRGTRTAGEYRANVHIDDDNVASIGARRQVERVSSTSDGVAGVSKSVAMNSAFAEYTFGNATNWLGLNDSLSLTAGGRLDRHEVFGSHATYRFTGAYQLKDTGTTLRGSFGSGFKAPTAYQLYAPIYGNANLTPEESLGADAGVEQSLLKNRLVARATLFWNHFRNLIDYDTTTYAYINAGRARTRGLETGLTWKPVDELTLGATYTYLDSEDLERHRPLARRARHSGRVSADWKATDDLTVGGDVRLVGKQLDSYYSNQDNPGYAVANAKVSYDITKKVSVFGRVENLLDAHYQEVLGYKTAGRSFYAGVKASF